MMGWMLIFALILLCGAIAVVSSVWPAPGVTSTLVFGFLLAVSGLTRVLRGRV